MRYHAGIMVEGAEAQKLRARLYAETRRFLSDAGYLEVEVPVLSDSLIPESHLEVFETRYIQPYTEPPTGTPLYLTPSPEVFLKRLLADGWPSLFSISRAFRNAESLGRRHNPEFTMLEFYTRNADYRDSVTIFRRFLDHLTGAMAPEINDYRRSRKREPLPLASRGEHPGGLRWAEYTVDALMRDRAGLPGGWAENEDVLAAAAGDIDLSQETFESLFNRIFVRDVEPTIPRDQAAVLMDYPAEVPTLARNRPNSPWSERWELYLFGLEVANCYTEALSPREVRAFFDSERSKKTFNSIVHRIDDLYPELFADLQHDVSGVAVGMDRLLMGLLGTQEIEELMAFPVRSMI